MLQSGAFFEIADREFDNSMVAVELISSDRVKIDVYCHTTRRGAANQGTVGLVCR